MATELLLETEYIGDSKIRQGDKRVGRPNNHIQQLQMHKNLGRLVQRALYNPINASEGSVSSWSYILMAQDQQEKMNLCFG